MSLRDAMAETENQTSGRIILVALVLLCFMLYLGARFFYWQIWRRDMRDEALNLRSVTQAIPPRRGEIRDNQGHLLAVEVQNYHICGAPAEAKREEWLELAERVAPIVNKPKGEILRLFDENAERSYVRLAWNVSASRAKVVESWKLRGLFLEPVFGRGYPEGDFAGQLLGYVNMDGVGNYGIEGFYDDLLAGEPGVQRVYDSATGRMALELRPAHDGASLTLTLNRAMQYEAERILRQAIEDQEAKSGTIIVLDPKTGSILVMANWPSFNPNDYSGVPYEVLSNPAISQQYEPGSVMKIITMAAGLDSGTVRRDSVYIDNGVFSFGARVIKNHDEKAYGRVSMTELLAYSLNIGAATISTNMGAKSFYGYLKDFGFGTTTGVDLMGESAGSLDTPGSPTWSESDLATNSYGQGMAVTPLQMITAVAAVANGGVLMQPHIVQEIRRGNEVQTIQPKAVRRVISEQAARDLTEMLVDAMRIGLEFCEINGYAVAGKTGTASIPIPGGYDPDPTAVIASFVGYLPAEDPRFVILVKVDRPQLGIWGSAVAVPAFTELAQRLLTLSDMPPRNIQLARGER